MCKGLSNVVWLTNPSPKGAQILGKKSSTVLFLQSKLQDKHSLINFMYVFPWDFQKEKGTFILTEQSVTRLTQ